MSEGDTRNPKAGLSKISLEWMLQEAKAEGLLTNVGRENEVLGRCDRKQFVAPPDPKAIMHDSLTGAWNVAELVPRMRYDWGLKKSVRRMNLWRNRTLPPGSLVHESAWQRSDCYSKKLPKDVTKYPPDII